MKIDRVRERSPTDQESSSSKAQCNGYIIADEPPFMHNIIIVLESMHVSNLLAAFNLINVSKVSIVICVQ